MGASVADNEWRVESTTWPPVRLPRLGDERLARLAARGSARAFAAVYERYHQPLYRYCRSIVRDDADAQDALQSTFTRALSALKREQRSAPLRPWLFRIAHNEAISVLRRRRHGDEALDDASLPVAASAADQAGERARLALLMSDLAVLPDRARSALVMRELSGLSHEEIAIALDTSTGAAKQAIFEARRGLAECAEGRAMACAEVCRAISDGDRRVLRGRRVRAHLRDCTSCSAFASSIRTRQADLRAVVPVLPVALSTAVLSRVFSSASGHAAGASAAGGAGAAAAGTAGKTIGVALGSKGFATASVLATAAVSVGGVAAVVRFDAVPNRAAGVHRTHPIRTSPAKAAHAHARAGAGTSVSAASSTGSIRHGISNTGDTTARVRVIANHGRGRSAKSHGFWSAAYGGAFQHGHGRGLGDSHGGGSAANQQYQGAQGAGAGQGVGSRQGVGTNQGVAWGRGGSEKSTGSGKSAGSGNSAASGKGTGSGSGSGKSHGQDASAVPTVRGGSLEDYASTQSSAPAVTPDHGHASKSQPQGLARGHNK